MSKEVKESEQDSKVLNMKKLKSWLWMNLIKDTILTKLYLTWSGVVGEVTIGLLLLGIFTRLNILLLFQVFFFLLCCITLLSFFIIDCQLSSVRVADSLTSLSIYKGEV